jgi:hypothetical protein
MHAKKATYNVGPIQFAIDIFEKNGKFTALAFDPKHKTIGSKEWDNEELALAELRSKCDAHVRVFFPKALT